MYYSKLIDSDTELNNFTNSDNTVSENACFGGGVVYKNASNFQNCNGPGYEHYPQGYDQLSDGCIDEYWVHNNCQVKHRVHFDSVVIQVYNNQGRHSHTAVMYDKNMEYAEALGHVESTLCHSIHDVEQYIMSFTNYVHYVDGQWAYVVYIHGKLENKVTGYHLYVQAIDGSSHTLIPYKYSIQGVLEVVKTVTLRLQSICNRNLGIRHTVVNNP